VDQLLKGNSRRDVPEDRRKLNDIQLSYVDQLVEENRVKQVFNNFFFTKADSRHPEIAGVAGSFMGSLFTLFTVFILSFPIAIGASVYLEEFAPKNRITELIEVNISNLAAVPSIVFGLLGLGVLLNVFGLPRSTPLVGGSVLALMTLPTIIIACRASLKAVPPSIKEGALAVGATKTQAVFHHVVPLALPGTLTGTIIGLAQALGETAPLIMIGMIAFIPNIPTGLTEPSAALPVQIYLWVESAERGFKEKSAAAIMVILIFLFMMNAIAVLLRNRFERKW
jgi:phosphate transport system permease protein